MIEKKLDRKWFNYFSNMRNKYNLRISANKPLVLFLEAKNPEKNKRELLQGNKNDFFDSLDKTARYFSNRYNCIALFETNKINFIIEDIYNFIMSINNEGNFRTHDIVSIFSQYFFEQFNTTYSKEPVYWHCKVFNIAKEKINSYIKFKSKGILNGIIYYNGDRIDISEYLEGNIVIMKNNKEENHESFLDLIDFDNSL